jgi:uncharacterized protein GlcG (DUF336 family)
MSDTSLRRALAMTDAALAFAAEQRLPPVAVVVMDAGGHVVTAVRQDGAGFAAIDIASAKARGALAFGVSSREVREFFGPSPALSAGLSVTLGGQMLPLPGAVLLTDADGRVSGAIAAAGGMPDDDEAAAAAGSRATNA